MMIDSIQFNSIRRQLQRQINCTGHGPGLGLSIAFMLNNPNFRKVPIVLLLCCSILVQTKIPKYILVIKINNNNNNNNNNFKS
jgi:hypothetical protein